MQDLEQINRQADRAAINVEIDEEKHLLLDNIWEGAREKITPANARVNISMVNLPHMSAWCLQRNMAAILKSRLLLWKDWFLWKDKERS